MTFPRRRLEPLTQRVRARIGKRTILDTTHAQLLFEHERHPHHRVDALPSGRHIQVLVNGEPLATTYRPMLMIETGVPPRWYIPPGDVRWDRLTPSPHHTTCQYKGQACYWTVDGTDPPLPVWSYLEPLPEAASLAGLIGITDDDPAVQLLIDDSPARRKNAG